VSRPSMTRGRRLAVCSLAAVATLGAATVAYAAFNASTTANARSVSGTLVGVEVAGGAEAPKVIYPNGERSLWPNVDADDPDRNPETGAHVATVEIWVTNTNEVAVRVDPAGVTGAATFAPGPDLGYCNSKLKRKAPLSIVVRPGPVIGPGRRATVIIDGIYLDESTDDRCQNLTFTTTWSVVATAV
jgi:hypothetical protein